MNDRPSADELLDPRLLPLAAIREVRPQTRTEAGAASNEADAVTHAEAIGVETNGGRRSVVARYTARYATIEILEREPCSDRLLRALLADGPLGSAGVRDAAKAIDITDSELEAAQLRLQVVRRRTARAGGRTLELRSPEDAERPPAEPPGCGHPLMWRTATGPWRCNTCHPPAFESLVHETAAAPPSFRSPRGRSA